MCIRDRLSGMPIKSAMQRAHEVLDYVGLGEARYRKVESYSTGMKQRIKIAAAIVHDPRLLILDEPTNGMDPAGREDILELARDLARKRGMSLLFSSHLLTDVESVCDQVMVLGRGRLLLKGKLEDLMIAHTREFETQVKGTGEAFFGRLRERGVNVGMVEDGYRLKLPEGASLSLVWETAQETGEQVRMLKPRRSTLEEVFLNALNEGAA